MSSKIVPQDFIKQRILYIRRQRVLLDSDLAELYGVSTKRLNEQVKRNSNRFPEDFAFRLNAQEKEGVVANCDHLKKLKFSPVEPLVFTEHGAIMAANVLSSKRAIEVSLLVVRVFIKLRETFAVHKELLSKVRELERKFGKHDVEIQAIFTIIKQLTNQPEKPKKKIGFHR